MNNQNVVISKIGVTIADITRFVTDIDHAGIDLTFGANDCLYIGSVFPFNALYLRLLSSAVNNNVSGLSVSFWNATSFVDFVSVQDDTSLAAATLGQSGALNMLAQDSTCPAATDSKYIAEIGNLEGYYGLYWTRLKFSAAMDKVTLKYVGQLFLDSDNALYKQYPDLAAAQYKAVYGTKTDFLDERIIASDCLISDLVTKGQILTGEQFLDWRLLKEPTMHKTAELIYKAQGQKYKEDMKAANAAYIHTLETRKFGISRSGDIKKGAEAYQRAPKRFYR
jgi:hypothetical protein